MTSLLARSSQSQRGPTVVLKNGRIVAPVVQLGVRGEDRDVFCSCNDKDQTSILSAIGPSLRQTDKRLLPEAREKYFIINDHFNVDTDTS
ncbi:hypothetical protein NHX12_025813 [Muraenolepis orangiensis]|uniref:Uncharacterized protein n=1 Tax=Muraenolepis orangiensis TaxID=630683 RepID=A0A9Q0EDX5_9TELE|nr:hypothetical protein NHX12_025813 [Muraenolepis orangiensis]